jgi:hypothetical protein
MSNEQDEQKERPEPESEKGQIVLGAERPDPKRESNSAQGVNLISQGKKEKH